MKTLKKILVLYIALLVTPVFAGANIHWLTIEKNVMAADLLAMSQYFQRMHTYQLEMTDASFENYTTDVYHQKATGYYKRNGYEFHSFMMGVHTIQDNVCRLTIDSAKKLMIVADPTKSMDNKLALSDYEFLLKIATKLQKAKVGDYLYYHMEFEKDYQFTAYDITLKDSLPVKAVMYYSKKVKQGDKLQQPRVEMNYDKWLLNVVDKETAFSISKYVEKKGGEYFLTPAYAGKYKLLDQRVLTKTNKKKKP
jgi:hypothetical protein